MIYCECPDEVVRFLADFARKKGFKIVLGYGCNGNTKFKQFAFGDYAQVYMTVEVTNPSYTKIPWLIMLNRLNKQRKKV
jgi:hypothetical protein